jgi:hypothetical protein
MGAEQVGKTTWYGGAMFVAKIPITLRRSRPADTSSPETISIDSIFYYLKYLLEYLVIFF